MRYGFDFRMGGVKNAGIGRYSFELLKKLAEASPKDQFFVYHSENISNIELKELEKFDNVHPRVAPFRHYSWKEQIFFPRLLDKDRLDLCHFPNFNVPIFYRRPYVVTIHDVVHHKLKGHKKSSWFYFQAYKYIIEQAVKRASKIITVSEHSKNEIERVLGVPAEKISVTYEGASFHPGVSQSNIRVMDNFGIKKPYLLAVGTLERKKQFPYLSFLVKCFTEQTGIKVDLVVVGKVDQHYPNIREEILASGAKGRVICTGFLSDEQLGGFYSGAFAYVSSSTLEGFGIPGVDAMQFGLPLCVVDTPVYNEVYDNAAVYFQPGSETSFIESLSLLFRDETFYKQLSNQSKQRGELFSWQTTAENTLKVYRESLNSAEDF